MARKKPGKKAPGVETHLRLVDYNPNRGMVLVQVDRQTQRFYREKSPAQQIAIGNYFRARQGFPSDAAMAEVLGVDRTRVAAWKGGTTPEPANAKLLSAVATVVEELARFLDPDVIPDWLLTEQLELDDRTPVQALGEGRLAEVLQVANATEHGAYV